MAEHPSSRQPKMSVSSHVHFCCACRLAGLISLEAEITLGRVGTTKNFPYQERIPLAIIITNRKKKPKHTTDVFYIPEWCISRQALSSSSAIGCPIVLISWYCSWAKMLLSRLTKLILLVAAKRDGSVSFGKAIDRDIAGADLFAHAHCPVDVERVQTRGETVRGRVGQHRGDFRFYHMQTDQHYGCCCVFRFRAPCCSFCCCYCWNLLQVTDRSCVPISGHEVLM
jgi:hypothetical protein